VSIITTDIFDDPNVIPRANQLAVQQEYYRVLCHINAFITFLRILQFFTFSRKLSAFSEVIYSAKYDILFFVLMFAFVSLALFMMALQDFARICSGSFRHFRPYPSIVQQNRPLSIQFTAINAT